MSSFSQSSAFPPDGLLSPSAAPSSSAPPRLYVPRDVEEVGRMLREIRGLGLRASVQYAARSAAGGAGAADAVVSLQSLDRIQQIDYEASTVRVQAGVTLAALDAHLSGVGLSLPVSGDDPALTVGDFASLGGAGITSYEYGLFVDNLDAVETVTLDGEHRRCRKADDPERFHRLLATAEPDEILTSVDCRTIRLEKSNVGLERKLTFLTNLSTFTERAAENLGNPAIMNHAIWLDALALGGARKIGLVSTYARSTKDGPRTLRDRIAEQYGRVLTSRPFAQSPVDDVLRTMSLADVLWGSKHLTLKSAESFAERMVDSAVGSPRWRLVVQAPLVAYPAIFGALQELFVRFREEHCNLSAIFSVSKPVRSPHLARLGLGERCAEIGFSIGLSGRRPMTAIELAQLSDRVASTATAHGATARTLTLEGPVGRAPLAASAWRPSGVVGV